MTEGTRVIVIGAGQAGLALSCLLSQAAVEHVVLERGRVGETWRRRWDSFCLVTPNWTVQLPEHPYDGDDPDGYMARDEVVGYLERYAAACAAPVREGVEVTSLRRGADGGFELDTSDGPLRRDDGGRGHGRLPAAAPAGRSHAAGDHATARRRRLSQSGGTGPGRRC